MILPSPYAAVVLALGSFRLLRLLSYDTFPPVARARAWLLGEQVVTVGSQNARMGVSQESVEVSFSYRRPLLAELVQCPYCLGLWLAAAVYVVWLYVPSWTLYGAAPLALSAAIGLIARNLDP